MAGGGGWWVWKPELELELDLELGSAWKMGGRSKWMVAPQMNRAASMQRDRAASILARSTVALAWHTGSCSPCGSGGRVARAPEHAQVGTQRGWPAPDGRIPRAFQLKPGLG